MIRKFLVFLLCFLLVGCTANEKVNTFTQMEMMNAISIMEKDSNYILLDVRTKEEYEEGHIPGSINIPNDEIQKDMSLLPDKNEIIYVYCRSGNRSKKAAQKLVDLGYKNIIEIGGIISYEKELEK